MFTIMWKRSFQSKAFNKDLSEILIEMIRKFELIMVCYVDADRDWTTVANKCMFVVLGRALDWYIARFHLDPVPFNIFVKDYKKELEDIQFYSINQNIASTLEVIILIWGHVGKLE